MVLRFKRGSQGRVSIWRVASLLCLLVSASACQTTPPKPKADITPESAQGVWEGKALIEDKQKGKTNNVTLDFVARRPGQLRMEVATPMGIHLASFVLSGERVSYALTRQKKYVTAPARPDVMRDLIAVSLDPRTIIDLLFDRPPDQDNWKCRLDGANLPSSCTSLQGEVTLTWPSREQFKRTIRIDAPSANVTMSLYETKSKVQINDKLFVLPSPSGFRETRIE